MFVTQLTRVFEGLSGKVVRIKTCIGWPYHKVMEARGFGSSKGKKNRSIDRKKSYDHYNRKEK